MNLHEIIQEQNKHSEKQLKVNPDGICRVVVNQNYAVTLETSLLRPGFFAYAVICIIDEHDLEILASVLEEMLFSDKDGPSFGLHKDSNSLVLWQYFDEASTDFNTYQQKLSIFVDVLKRWQSTTKQPAIPEYFHHSLKDLKLKLTPQSSMKIFFA